MTLVGRSAELEAATSAIAPMTLIVGDSGTGKSALLEFAQAQAHAAIAPPPVRLSRSPGSLQVGLLEALGATLAEITADESSAERVGRLVVDAAGRVREKRLTDLKATVGRHLLGIVRARLGDELGDALGEFADALSKSRSEALSSRITSASDSDVVDQIVEFAAEIAALDSTRDIYLALDDVDRLDDADLRRLLDLAERLPKGVRLRCAFATWDAEGRSRSELLAGSSSVQSVQLGGLSASHVSRWLRDAGLSETLTGAVMASTNGYAVHVQDAIAILQTGNPDALDSLAPDDVLKARLAGAWRGLDTIHQVAVAKLCAYVDPIETERVCALLGVDGITWGTILIGLRDSGIFVGSERTWFHELRRRVLWHEVLTDDMREFAVSSALAELDQNLQLPSADPDAFVEYARLAGMSTELRSRPGVDGAIAMSRDGVAIAAAAFELVESRRGDKAILADTVLEHVRQTCGFSDNPIDALDALAEAKILYVQSNEHASVIVPMWGSVEALRVLIGRSASELGRSPVQFRASAVFDTTLRQPLGDFKLGSYGVGRPGISELAEQAAELHRQPQDGVISIGGERPSLVMLSSHGDVPMYGAFAYTDSHERDQAVSGMRNFETTLWDEPFRVHQVVALPGTAVPSMRFAAALDWLDGGRFNLHMKQPADTGSPVETSVEVEQRLAVRRWARTRADEWERHAFGLEEESSFAHAEDSATSVVLEIVGSESIRELDAANINWSGPHARLIASQLLDLSSSERIGTITWQSGRRTQDPIGMEVKRLLDNALRFNREQDPVKVEFSEGVLRGLFQDAHVRRRSDAETLIELLPGVGLSMPAPKRTCVVIRLAEPQKGWVYGHHAALSWMAFGSEEEDSVELRILPSAGGDGYAKSPSEAEIRELFDATGPKLESGWSDSLAWIAGKLGFDERSLRLIEPR